jgi:uncharacterized protein YndB with AHSA1/START domain
MIMSNPDYVYVSVIAAPRDKVWEALTSPEFTQQYWHQTRVRSDFQVGSPIVFLVENDQIGCEGEVLIADFPRELSYTWRFPRNPETAAEPHSRVSFVLDEHPKGTLLTVRHDRFPPDSKTFPMIAAGWPFVICGLKTLLETGQAVDFSTES